MENGRESMNKRQQYTDGHEVRGSMECGKAESKKGNFPEYPTE